MPASLNADTLVKLHESYQGIEQMRLRARSCVFWNGINRYILLKLCASVQRATKCSVPNRVNPCHIGGCVAGLSIVWCTRSGCERCAVFPVGRCRTARRGLV